MQFIVSDVIRSCVRIKREHIKGMVSTTAASVYLVLGTPSLHVLFLCSFKVTSELPYGPIRTEPIEVQFLQVLLKAVGAKNYLEIGKLINVVVRSGRKPAVESPQLKEKATVCP